MEAIKTAEEILQPYVEIPFRHTRIIEEHNAILAMKQFALQFTGLTWISIKDQKPNDYERVIYFDYRDKGEIGIGYFVWTQTPVDYVTHWMPQFSFPQNINKHGNKSSGTSLFASSSE